MKQPTCAPTSAQGVYPLYFLIDAQSIILTIFASSLLFISAFGLVPTVLIIFTVFFYSIEKKYRATFFSLTRGKGLTVFNFRHGIDDETKANIIFTNSRHLWTVIEEEVRGWIEGSWSRWQDEKPSWFDEDMKGRVPLDFIPNQKDRLRENERRNLIFGIKTDTKLQNDADQLGVDTVRVRRRSVANVLDPRLRINAVAPEERIKGD